MLKRTKSFLKQAKKLLKSKKGFFVDTGVKILICVVLGSLVLGGLYTTFNGTIMPSVKSKVESMFEYSDGGSGIGEGLLEFEAISCDAKMDKYGYGLEFSHEAGNVKNVYFDSIELTKGTDFSFGTTTGGEFLVYILSAYAKEIPSGEHSLKIITDNGIINHTVIKE